MESKVTQRNTGSESRSLLDGLRSWLKARAQMHAYLYLLGQKLRRPRDYENLNWAIPWERHLYLERKLQSAHLFT